MKRAPAHALGLLCALACGRLPQTHHYVLAPAAAAVPAAVATAGVLTVEPFSASPPYVEDRIVYRPGPHRLEYYNYHLWSGAPAGQVTEFVRDSLSSSGRFRGVTRELVPETVGVLSGYVHALEEVDASEISWFARVDMELLLRDPEGRLLWSRRFVETEPLERRHPAGVARAASVALGRIASVAGGEIARVVAGSGSTSVENDANDSEPREIEEGSTPARGAGVELPTTPTESER